MNGTPRRTGAPPAWDEIESPAAMSQTSFRSWRRRHHEHQKALKTATGWNDFKQFAKEVKHLEKHAKTLRKARNFRRNEEETDMKNDNTRLVGKLCDVALTSEDRQRAILSPPSRLGPTSLHKPLQRRVANEMHEENLKMLRRLQHAHPVVEPVGKLEDNYKNVHVPAKLRMTRFKRKQTDTGLRPLPHVPHGKLTDPDWDWRPGAQQQQQQRWPPRLPPVGSQSTSTNADGPLPNGWNQPPSPFGASPPWSPGQQEADLDDSTDTPKLSQSGRVEESSGSGSCASPVADQHSTSSPRQQARLFLTLLYKHLDDPGIIQSYKLLRAQCQQDASQEPLSQEEQEEQTKAALKIQATHRGKAGRKEAAARKAESQDASQEPLSQEEQEEQTKAVLKIQATHRGKAGRKKAEAKKAESQEAAKEQEKAVLKIQATHRGKAGRKKADAVKAQRQEEIAATKIQSTFRGKCTRKALQEDDETEDEMDGNGSKDQDLPEHGTAPRHAPVEHEKNSLDQTAKSANTNLSSTTKTEEYSEDFENTNLSSTLKTEEYTEDFDASKDEGDFDDDFEEDEGQYDADGDGNRDGNDEEGSDVEYEEESDGQGEAYYREGGAYYRDEDNGEDDGSTSEEDVEHRTSYIEQRAQP